MRTVFFRVNLFLIKPRVLHANKIAFPPMISIGAGGKWRQATPMAAKMGTITAISGFRRRFRRRLTTTTPSQTSPPNPAENHKKCSEVTDRAGCTAVAVRARSAKRISLKYSKPIANPESKAALTGYWPSLSTGIRPAIPHPALQNGPGLERNDEVAVRKEAPQCRHVTVFA